MVKELKYMVIHYTKSDLDYIDLIIADLNNISEEIVNFFNLVEFGEKVEIILNDNIEKFRKKYVSSGYSLEKSGNVPKWTCGFSKGNIVETLCLNEFRKAKSHENSSIRDLIYLILHEFTHSCHNKFNSSSLLKYAWLSEGLATTISHQYDNIDFVFNASLNQMIDGTSDYRNYYKMFKYVLDKYGRDYILNLINDVYLLKSETPKLYNEVSEAYSIKNIKRN